MWNKEGVVMKINKTTVLMLSAWAAVVGMFNIIIFAVFDNRGENFWLAYCFTMLAFVIQIGAYYIAYSKKISGTELTGYPITFLSIIYLLIQSAVSLIFMSKIDVQTKTVVIINTLILGTYILLLILSVIGKDAVLDREAKTKSKTFFINSTLIDIESLANKTADPALKKQLTALADVLRYSDPMSSDSLAPIESAIAAGAADLGNAVNSGDVDAALEKCKSMELLIVERNKKCQLLK
jgi:hypothetical protein